MKLTKSQLESLRFVSVRGERYVHQEDLQALLKEQDDADKVAGPASDGGDRPKSR